MKSLIQIVHTFVRASSNMLQAVGLPIVCILVCLGAESARASAPTPADSGIGADFATSERSLAGTWRFQLDVRNEGKADKQTWGLRVTIPGQPPHAFDSLDYADRKFKKLTWIGFMSTARSKAVYYRNNIQLSIQRHVLAKRFTARGAGRGSRSTSNTATAIKGPPSLSICWQIIMEPHS